MRSRSHHGSTPLILVALCLLHTHARHVVLADEERLQLDVPFEKEVPLEEPRHELGELIPCKETSRDGEDLVKLLQRELLRLAHEDEGEAEGEEVGAGVEAWRQSRQARADCLASSPNVPVPPRLRSWNGNLDQRRAKIPIWGRRGTHTAAEDEVGEVVEGYRECLSQLAVREREDLGRVCEDDGSFADRVEDDVYVDEAGVSGQCLDCEGVAYRATMPVRVVWSSM